MNVLCSINHPAHVHFYCNLISLLRGEGHTVTVTHRDKDITTALLDAYNITSVCLSTQQRGTAGLLRELVAHESRMFRILKRDKIDVALSIGGTFIVHACALRRIPALVFSDTENAGFQNRITYPFATKVITPECYRYDLGRKQVRYRGYHELAYLHPRYFTPDPSVLNLLGTARDEKFVIMRFVGWGAVHDAGHAGISLENKRRAVREFSRHARVFITSEKELPPDLEPYRITIPVEQIHDALSFASLLYGESATMASECAVLGTPAIYLDDEGRGYTDDQETRYGSVFNYTECPQDQVRSIEKGVEILIRTRDDIRGEWQEKRKRLLDDTIDVTAWMADLVREYA